MRHKSPLRQQLDDSPDLQIISGREFRKTANAQAIEYRIETNPGGVGGVSAPHFHGHWQLVFDELPARIGGTFTKADASVS